MCHTHNNAPAFCPQSTNPATPASRAHQLLEGALTLKTKVNSSQDQTGLSIWCSLANWTWCGPGRYGGTYLPTPAISPPATWPPDQPHPVHRRLLHVSHPADVLIVLSKSIPILQARKFIRTGRERSEGEGQGAKDRSSGHVHRSINLRPYMSPCATLISRHQT